MNIISNPVINPYGLFFLCLFLFLKSFLTTVLFSFFYIEDGEIDGSGIFSLTVQISVVLFSSLTAFKIRWAKMGLLCVLYFLLLDGILKVFIRGPGTIIMIPIYIFFIFYLHKSKSVKAAFK
jgi:hypothetical protein